MNALRQSVLEAQALECGDHIAARQCATDRDVQALACEQIEDCQRSEAPPISELIGRKSMLQMSFRVAARRRCSRCTAVAWRQGIVPQQSR